MPRKTPIAPAKKDPNRQTQLHEYYGSSGGKVCLQLKTPNRKCPTKTARIFREDKGVIIIDSDSENENLAETLPQVENFDDWESIYVEARKLPFPLDEDEPVDVIVKFPPAETQNRDGDVKFTMISINKNLFAAPECTPEKLKPRVLQSLTKQGGLVPESTILGSKDLNASTDLIERVNRNIECTKFSSLGYKRRVSTSDGLVRSPKKKTIDDSFLVEEVTNPRVVSLVTKIIKYVFSKENLKMLFTSEEILCLEKFYDMPFPEYNFICYKLFTRLPKWYNIFKFCELIQVKLDTPHVVACYECLKSNGFVLTDYSCESVSTLLNLLQVHEVKEIATQFRLKPKSSTKSALIELLLQNCKKQTTLTVAKTTEQILSEKISNKLGMCVKLSDNLYDLFQRVHILYSMGTWEFAKLHDLYLFMGLVDSGDVILPEYKVEDAPLFDKRDDFLSFAKATQFENELVNSLDLKKFDNAIEVARKVYGALKNILNDSVTVRKPNHLNRFTPGARYARALSTAVKSLTPQYPGDVADWLECLLWQNYYSQSKRGLWYVQLALIEAKYFKNHVKSAKTVIRGFEDASLPEVASYDLSVRANTLINSKKNKVDEVYRLKLAEVVKELPESNPFPSVVVNAKAVIGNESGRKRSYVELQEDGDQLISSVEITAINHYLRTGFKHGIHCEGSLLTNLLFTLFWDIIYDPSVKFAFVSEIQYIPLDFNSVDFYVNRKERIDQRLQDISEKWTREELQTFVLSNWLEHSHKKTLIMANAVDEIQHFGEIIDCIGRVPLAKVLRRLLCNFGAYRSGLPDLFVWNFYTKKCRFVEVKGQNDQLSTKQKLWLNFLRSVGLDIEVCYVHTIGSKATNKIRKIRSNQKTD